MYTESKLKTMSNDDLSTILMNEFGIVPDDDDKKADLVAKILEAQEVDSTEDGEGIQANNDAGQGDTPDPDAGDDTEGESPAVSMSDAERAKKEIEMLNGRCWIMIANSNEPGGDKDVFISVNDNPISIKRNKWVKVKKMHVMALDDATQTVYEKSSVNGKEATVEREVPRYNIQVRTLEQGPGETPKGPGNHGRVEPRFKVDA